MTTSISSSTESDRSVKEVKKINISSNKDISNIFEALIISLNLQEQPAKSKSLLFGKRPAPFSFSVENAVQKLTDFQLDIELKMAKTTIAYTMKPSLAFSLLKRFFDAKLLHYPTSRTEGKLSSHGTLQVTPKGTAMVYSFCQNIGMPTRNMPEIVKSNFNTMELLVLERSSNELNILYSDHLINILFSTMMGPQPNVWSPDRKPDPISCIFNETASFDFLQSYDADCPSPMGKSDVSEVSPFHHKYFTNPESDSHIQYYVSDTGVRVFSLKAFMDGEKRIVVDYCVSGKAIVQWLSECTSVMCRSEAISIARLFVKADLLRKLTVDDEVFLDDRSAFYVLTSHGSNVCRWGHKKLAPKQLISEEDFELRSPSFKQIIRDPGLRLLFKIHMQKERCVENVKAYFLFTTFIELEQKVVKLYKHYNKLEEGPKKTQIRNAIDLHTSKFFSKAFQLYSTYISPELQFDLNIDYKLRQDAQRMMAMEGPRLPTIDHMMTPMAVTFAEHDIADMECLSDPVPEPDSYFPYETTDLAKTVSLIKDIHGVFRQIAESIFRLMEIDSYPKFIRSASYLEAIACGDKNYHGSI